MVSRLGPVVLLLTVALPLAARGESGQADLVVTTVHRSRITVPAGVAYVIETVDLAPAAADSVLHVQDAAGAYVAGNDDVDVGQARSSVNVAAAGAARELIVVVRAASPAGAGAATLRMTPAGGSPVDEAITFGGVEQPLAAALGAGALLTTVEQPHGPRATILLAISGGDPAHALAFAEDGGIDGMAALRLDDACAPSCTLVVGAVPGADEGPVSLVWDQDVESADGDGDGLGDELEAALGTAPGARDSDDDGLEDGAEVLGVASDPPVKLPLYGADPLQADIFVETDWQACDPLVDWCGPNAARDRYKLPAWAAARLAGFFAPDFTVHVDNGVDSDPDDPAMWTVHGDWGAATRQPIGNHPCDPDVLGVRFGYFHRGVVSGFGGGGGGTLFGFCFGSDSLHMGVAAQEIGHNFGLDHGGDPPSFPANCKPHYRSPMNYAYTYDNSVRTFSRNQLAGVVLDPTSMNELAGLGTTDPDVLASLRNSTWDLDVQDDGAIDWNRDGRFDADVRAAPTWASASCEQSRRHGDDLTESLDPVLAWLPVAGGTPRLYLITRGSEDGRPQSRWATRFDLCDYAIDVEACTDWTPGRNTAPVAIDHGVAGQGGPAIESFVAGGTDYLLLVYPDSRGRLVWQRLTIEAGGGERWDPPQTVDESTLVTGSVALVRHGARLLAWAPSDGALYGWEYDPDIDAWSEPRPANWSDDTPIQVCDGIAVTRGQRADLPGERVFAVIPTGDFCQLEMGVREDASGRWERMPDTAWPTTRFLAGARPGLAYVPFDVADPTEGRFYVAWKPVPTGALFIAMTEGNDLATDATSRRLVWSRGIYFSNVWAIVAGSVALEFDPRFDENLRAAWGFGPKSDVGFFPFADGIAPASYRDQDDYAAIRPRLACSLTGTCP